MQFRSGWTRAKPVDLIELQLRCDRMLAMLQAGAVERPQLLAMDHSLELVAQGLEHSRRDRRLTGRVTQLLDRAVLDIQSCLYAMQPYRPYIWASALQDRMERALRETRLALVALQWNAPR